MLSTSLAGNATPNPSLFVDPIQRDYYRDMVANIGPTGWLRFTRMEWNGRAIAFHFGLSYHGRFLFGIPSFDIEFQRHSPGEVLLRQLLLAAIEEGAAVFDFGPGEEAIQVSFCDQRSSARDVGHLSRVRISIEGSAMNRIMVISPHPDDESIGCGGTISKHVAEGDVVQVELLTSGEKGGHGLE